MGYNPIKEAKKAVKSGIKRAKKRPVETLVTGGANIPTRAAAEEAERQYKKIMPGTPTAGKKALQKAMKDAVAAKLEMFHKGLEMTAPYRESGERALGGMVESVGPDSSLYRMQDTAGRGGIATTLAKMGYSPEEITRALGRFGEQLEAREFDQRTGRMADVVNLGQGFAARGQGAASSTGSGMASSIIRGGAGMADAYGYKAAAGAVPLAAATYGIDRAVGDIYLNKILNTRQNNSRRDPYVDSYG